LHTHAARKSVFFEVFVLHPGKTSPGPTIKIVLIENKKVLIHWCRSKCC